MRYGWSKGNSKKYILFGFTGYRGEVERIEIAHSNGMLPTIKIAVREDVVMHLYEIKP